MPFQNNVLAGASGATGYEIPYSLRFRASNSAYLSRTPSAADATRTKASISIWLKRGALGGRYSIYSINPAGSAGASNQITMIFDNAGSNGDNLTYNNGSVNRTSTSLYRDPSAWYNFCQIFDTTQATAADRVKTYINGVLLTDINIGQDFTLNSNTPFGQSGITEYIGRRDSGLYYDGYMAEVVFVIGQALTPSSFGQTDSATGVWVPKKYSGTYGTNGFYLKFADASAATATAIGKDSSGNGNNFTPSGISVTSGTTFDQMTDTPTSNSSTLNPLASHTSVGTFSAANMEWSYSAGSYYPIIVGSAAINSKTYWEVTVTSVGGAAYIGIILTSQQVKGTEGTNNTLSSAGCWSYDNTGKKNNNNAPGSGAAYGASYTTGDVIGVTYDPSATTLTFYKNGSSQGTAYTTVTSGDVYAFVSGISGANFALNFGQRAFSYTPPTGFKALNTTNIASAAVTTSGSFTGNAAADGPFIWANGNPATLTINGNAVTFGTHADKTAGGFKLRTSSASYNTSGTNNWTATAGNRFVQSKKPNNSQLNP